MTVLSDIEIAQACTLQPIDDIAARLDLPPAALEHYGRYKAKLNPHALPSANDKKRGKLILVTAMSPTPAGEGKTMVAVGLADALSLLGQKTVVALREPSLGPVFGIKGGAAGGGHAQLVPMEDINLHFTGDFHAIGAANNLLAAMLDNHLHHGNALNIDPRRIIWKRCVDMNDRQLRNIVSGLGGRTGGVPHEDGYHITVATEVMAVLCLARDITDLKARLGRMLIAYAADGSPITAADLNAHGAMAALLKDAIKPNLVQTLEGTPALVHGGPFANIAHGCNSVVATQLALQLADYTVTEAGFGADLGAEKFLDIKCRSAGLRPDATVVVATIRALKHHGGAEKGSLHQENPQALQAGLPNLLRHVENLRQVYGLAVVVAINRFITDSNAEIALLQEHCARLGIPVAMTNAWAKGGAGSTALAEEVITLCRQPAETLRYAYELNDSIENKLNALARNIYHANGVILTPAAAADARRLNELGYGNLPICMAKTQYSFSDDASKLAAPRDFDITVRALQVSAGAGFIVALSGSIMTMPGLPKVPAAEKIDVDDQGMIHGLF
ncbi:MAG: formate--tetrahydrofolate ligase [Neisseria sp.]|nr:formate--tetrahydrofolate ligase [Neisseria sp.]